MIPPARRAPATATPARFANLQLDDAFFEFTAWQGRVDASQATIAELEVFLERCVVRAPFDGAVVRKLTDVGQWIDAGGDVVEMVAVNREGAVIWKAGEILPLPIDCSRRPSWN